MTVLKSTAQTAYLLEKSLVERNARVSETISEAKVNVEVAKELVTASRKCVEHAKALRRKGNRRAA